MKKVFPYTLYLFFPAGVIISHAQITISQWDVASPGYQLQMAHDTEKTTAPGSITPGFSGANQTWNFSTLSGNTVDTLTFTNPNWFPSGSNFPDANLAIINSTDGSEVYLENTPNGLFIDGVYADPLGQGAMALKFNPIEQLADFTTTYQTTFQNTSGIFLEFPFNQFGLDSVRFKEIKDKDMKTDGWGTITTPLGGPYNCLRNRARVITNDSIWVHNFSPPGWFLYSSTIDTVWHFAWWTNGAGFPLLEFDSTHLDTVKNITWLKSFPVIGGISATALLSELNVYPNPSTGKFTVESNGEISVYNCIGEKVYMKTSTAGKTELNLSSQSDGIYFLHINNKKETVTRKIIISR